MPRRPPSNQSHQRWIRRLVPGSRRFAPGLVLAGALLAGTASTSGSPSLLALALGLVCGPLAFHHALRYYRESGESDWMAMCLFLFAGWPLAQLAADPEALSRVQQAGVTGQYFGLVVAGWGVSAWLRVPRHAPPRQ